MPRVLHVAHGAVVVEVVVEIESLFHLLRIVVGEFDAGLLPPEQVRHQADKSGLREFVRMPAHGLVDAPDFHDGDNGTGRGAVWDGEIGSHFPVAQLDSGSLRLHGDARAALRAGRLSSKRAFPAKILSRSAAERGSASTALVILAIKPRPCSASERASVANRHEDAPTNGCPQRVGAISPLSAVSA